jgi:hypothetical protein
MYGHVTAKRSFKRGNDVFGVKVYFCVTMGGQGSQHKPPTPWIGKNNYDKKYTSLPFSLSFVH